MVPVESSAWRSSSPLVTIGSLARGSGASAILAGLVRRASTRHYISYR